MLILMLMDQQEDQWGCNRICLANDMICSSDSSSYPRVYEYVCVCVHHALIMSSTFESMIRGPNQDLVETRKSSEGKGETQKWAS